MILVDFEFGWYGCYKMYDLKECRVLSNLVLMFDGRYGILNVIYKGDSWKFIESRYVYRWW